MKNWIALVALALAGTAAFGQTTIEIPDPEGFTWGFTLGPYSGAMALDPDAGYASLAVGAGVHLGGVLHADGPNAVVLAAHPFATASMLPPLVAVDFGLDADLLMFSDNGMLLGLRANVFTTSYLTDFYDEATSTRSIFSAPGLSLILGNYGFVRSLTTTARTYGAFTIGVALVEGVAVLQYGMFVGSLMF